MKTTKILIMFILSVLTLTTVAQINKEICVVTTDTNTWKNAIYWLETPGYEGNVVNVYRSSDQSTYVNIGSTIDSVGHFVDTLVNPSDQSYFYKIFILDNSGNESALSPYHQTIHLLASMIVGGNLYIGWESYVAENIDTVILYYNVYKLSQSGSLIYIDSAGASDIGYGPFPIDTTVYVVEGVKLGCGNKSLISSFSNIANYDLVTHTTEGYINSPKINIYPNPTKDKCSISCDNMNRIVITDLLGNTVMKYDLNDTNNFTFDCSNLPVGSYLIQIRQNNNQITTKKLLIS